MSLNEGFDVAIIGGGATGLGCAVDAVSRGYRTLLLEARTFGSGTSSRSTKLFHGGVRYLAQGRIGLVREALAERAILRRNAPDVVWELPIVVPAHNLRELTWYTAGLKCYDALAGSTKLAPSRVLSARETLERVPNLRREGLRGGVRYVDAQFDDAALAAALARTASAFGAVLQEHARVVDFVKGKGRIAGVVTSDSWFHARTVINATGVWSDALRKLSDPQARTRIAVSRGSHLIASAEVLGGSDGVLIPRTDDGRVVFALPWKSQTLIGTTDVAVTTIDDDPNASEDEIAYLITHVNRYLEHPVSRESILGTFAGLRPLLAGGAKAPARLSREHHIDVDKNGLISVLGGKWTTYRRMANDAIDRAARVGTLAPIPSRTADLPLWTRG